MLEVSIADALDDHRMGAKIASRATTPSRIAALIPAGVPTTRRRRAVRA
jgi:hypothetical protein